MKKFRWILLSGLLVAATTQIAQAQPPGVPTGPTNFPTGPTNFPTGPSNSGGAANDGSFSNAPVASTTTTTTTTGVAPDVAFVPVDDAVMGDSGAPLVDTGGEPLIAVLAGLSIAGAAVAMRRKVTA